MAPKHQDTKGGDGKGKMTVVMFQLEGSDETLRDAIRVMGHGLEKMAPSAPIYKIIQAPTQARASALLSGSEELEELGPEVFEPEESTETDETAAAGQGSGEKPKRRRIQKAIVAVKGIDWDLAPGWREYAKQKNADNASARYLVVAGWFKNHRDTAIIGPGHIVAAFDVMDWPKPEDIPHVFARIKNKREWFDKGEKPNEWTLGQRGINALDKLGKENPKSGDE